MCCNPIIIPSNPVNPDRKHRKWSKSWKATSKRCHQYRKIANITLTPGYAVLGENDAYIIPFDEVVTYA